MDNDPINNPEALRTWSSDLANTVAATKPDSRQDKEKETKTRGRPPGTVSARSTINAPRQPPKPAKPELTPEQILAAKKKRADQLAKSLESVINDNIIEVVMSLGIPAQMLYKPGMVPESAPSNSPYSDLGQKLVLGPQQLNSIGRFIAEIEGTSIGEKLPAAGGNSPMPMIFYGILSLAGIAQYVQGLAQVGKMFKQFNEAQERNKKQQEQATQEGNTNG